MKVICLIPSITETLITCGVNVVGRSRFCIHPQPAVDSIPKIGGTKDASWEKAADYKPDLVILDKEENTREMADTCPFDLIALHIIDIASVATELKRLAGTLGNEKLGLIAKRWARVAESPLPARLTPDRLTLDIPGVIQWWRQPASNNAIKTIQYLIWKDPWMAIGNNTFIYSVLVHLGFSSILGRHSQKYPEVNLDDFSPQSTLLLFSSEPFPFERHQTELMQLGYCCALVDGEKYSWYGIRSLDFLEKEAQKHAI